MTAVATWLAEAMKQHQAGHLAAAERIYNNILRLDPRHGDALQFLGLIALSRGDAVGAIERLRQALHINPRAGLYHFHLGLALSQRGDRAEAGQSYRTAIKHAPQLVEAHNNLGVLLREAGEPEAAVESLRRAVALRPTYVEGQLNLSTALSDLDRVAEAEGVARRALSLAPNLAQAHFQLGAILHKRSLLEDAITAYRAGLALQPDHLPSLLNLGNALQSLGRIAEAIAVFEQLLARQPHSVEVLNNLGNACLALARRDEAIAWYQRALEVDPAYVLALNNLGVALQETGQVEQAIATYRRALAISPDADACNNLGLATQMFGDYAEARALFKRAVELRPGFSTAYRHLMTVMLYDPSLDEAGRWEIAHGFEALYGAPIYARVAAPDAVARAAERRLRVGYVSSDLYEHPVGRNLEPVLAHRDRAGFEVICYADVPRPDGLTGRLQGLVDAWRPITGLSDEQVAGLVRADGVDVLVILAGRFDRNRPLVTAYKPAPVRVSFHDPGTSGLSAMEYLIADPVLVPRGTVERFSERVVRLPSFYIHAPLQGPEVGELPLRRRGYPTFGSFNNPAKVNQAVLRLWGEVLRAVPAARLKVKCKNWFANSTLRARFLTTLDVPAERVEFDTLERGLQDHLGLYHDVDVALDPFPFTGSTTTFEALWMGVPVVTLLGERMAGRWSASMLTALRLPELIAGTAEEYVRIASGLVEAPERLSALRSGLRDRVAASPLCDGPSKARQVERIYRSLWRRWCRSGEAEPT